VYALLFKVHPVALLVLTGCEQNYIKRNATQHDNFRAVCVGFAQRLHRIDMRLRLGLLQDPAAIERQIQRELKEAERKRSSATPPTVKTEAETLADDAAKSKERKEVADHVKAAHKPPRIRPLSENKAIETGANFIAETFLFLVAGGLILAESWRRDRKEKRQDADVAEAIAVAEREREEMREKLELLQAEIEALMDEKKPFDEVRQRAVASLHKPASTLAPTKTAQEMDEIYITVTPHGKDGKPHKITLPLKDVATTMGPNGKPTAFDVMVDVDGKGEVTGLKSNGQPIPLPASKSSQEANTHEKKEPLLPKTSSSQPQATPAQVPASPTSSWLPTGWLGGKEGDPKSKPS
jgi:hypothetical protein